MASAAALKLMGAPNSELKTATHSGSARRSCSERGANESDKLIRHIAISAAQNASSRNGNARTFGFAEQLWQLRQRGLARGGSIRNAVLLRAGRVANREGLRFHDEFVRHKALDVIGDLALAGAPIIGHYRGSRPGHSLNTQLLRLLMNDPDAWTRVPARNAEQIIAGRMNHAAPCGKPQESLADDDNIRREPARGSGRGQHARHRLRLLNNDSS